MTSTPRPGRQPRGPLRRPRPVHPRRRRAPVVAAALLGLLALLVPLGALAGPVGSAQAAARQPGVDASGDGDHIDVDGRDGGRGGSRPGGSAGGSGSSGGAGAAGGPVVVVRYVLTCPGNSPATPSDHVTCTGATETCLAPQMHYWRYVATDGGPWRLDGTRCLAPGEAVDGQEFPGFGVQDLRSLPLPAGEVLLEPGNGYALVGVPVNAVAGAAALVLPAPVAGFDVQVRATPVSYTWDFGDGTTLGPTADPGAPYPAMTTTHLYEVGGRVSVTLTTTYAGEFSVDGGAFTPVDGTAAVVSAPVPLAVLTARGALVGDLRG